MKILTLNEACDFLKVSRWTIYRMIKSGRLPAFKINEEWRFLLSDLELFVKEKLTYYGLTAIKGLLYHAEVLERYRSDIMKYYLHDEAFSGRLGLKQDYYHQICGSIPESDKLFLPELHYRKVRLGNGKLAVMLPIPEFNKLSRLQEEQSHWAKFTFP
jgi:excisionase family DNA binding protein